MANNNIRATSEILTEEQFDASVGNVQGIVVEKPFYERLIAIAAGTFKDAQFEDIQDKLIEDIQKQKNMNDLMCTLDQFIDDRAFIDKVISEKQRIEYNKL